MFEIGTFEIGTFEISTFEISTLKIGTVEIGTLKIGTVEIGLHEISKLSFNRLQRCLAKVAAVKVIEIQNLPIQTNPTPTAHGEFIGRVRALLLQAFQPRPCSRWFGPADITETFRYPCASVQGDQQCLLGIAGLYPHRQVIRQAQFFHGHGSAQKMVDQGNKHDLPIAGLRSVPMHFIFEEPPLTRIERRRTTETGPLFQAGALVPAVELGALALSHVSDVLQQADDAPGDEIFAEALVGKLEGVLIIAHACLSEKEGGE